MPLSPTLGYYGVFLYHLFYTCAFFGLMGVLFSSILDWYFYGFWTVPFIGNFHFNVILGKFILLSLLLLRNKYSFDH